MEETHVVTVFLRNGTDVLLFRRSDDVGSYAGRWGAVAGHAEGDPDAQARVEVREETGIDPETDTTLARAGDPFPVTDDERGTRWVVHPYLFDCDTRDVTPNYETTTYEWVSPTAIRERETVPRLWTSYDRVRPTVESVRDDGTHGSAYISLRACEVLRDDAAAGADYDALLGTARDLLAARESMAAVANRVHRVVAEADTADADGILASATAVLDAALAADDEAAAAAAAEFAGASLLTLSRSGTAFDAVVGATPERVVVAESRTGREGVDTAERLADAGLDVALTTDAAVASLVAAVDAVLVGADTVLRDGSVVNKVGTRAAALAAAEADVPVYAVCATDKIAPETDPDDPDVEDAPSAELYDGDASLDVVNPLFDVTPASLVTGVVTEDGVLDEAGVESAAADLAALRDWQ
ncbi:translation initiation factor 2B subunit (eIF-2B alpha/beta/delta family) [Halarchaeum rubridurum]|uniref:Translation initiation factor 2B subunit (eIF-2B alpha/beta/delta family) n=1 Tax=Halarchaeum rubridurum TaxID=489911 RepID=A0A830G139_9EURY|nr:NUDIX domain-containing protein [Halarchaeum rubridurum]MBP1954939.1 translation initiation factor 2B subunit (eIF-2B alpha/beta/delta family) [Halarchaeum rubridurum]GGM70215.1 translation initiation factor 2B subunit alpha [Halarchaeum rubridurum]